MFRLWGKIFKDNHMLRDTVIEDDRNDTRTHKIFDSLDQICYDFDLGKSDLARFQYSGIQTPQAKLVFTRIVL